MVQAALKDDSGADKEAYNEDLYERFCLWRDQTGKSQQRVAVLLGRSTAAVSQYVNRKFLGDLAEMEKDIAALLRREEELDFAPAARTFCSTTPATLIWEVLQYCDQKRKMGVALGHSGIGKTVTCQEYKKKNRATVYCTADVSTRSVGNVLRLIASRLGGGKEERSISSFMQSTIRKLKNSNRLLIIDDAHFLSWEGFEAVRKIHDCAGIGVVYVGQERLYDQMRGGDSKARLFDQIFSRIAMKREDFRLTRKDAVQVAQAVCPDGLDKACRDYLFKVAKSKGRLRLMCNLLEVALEVAKMNEVPMTVGLLEQAEQFMMGR